MLRRLFAVLGFAAVASCSGVLPSSSVPWHTAITGHYPIEFKPGTVASLRRVVN